MTMKTKLISLCLGGALSTSVIAQPPLPDWYQLEAFHDQDGGIESARNSIVAALPIGTEIDVARSALIADGATCRPKRHQPGVERCLIHQYSLADGAADDVRWTITLSAPTGRVEVLTVNREVDRHGSA
jgi:hypothetical protein